MEKEQIKEELAKLADEECRTKLLLNYPPKAKSVIGVPQLNINELARMLSHEVNWEELCDSLIAGDSFDEMLLGAAIMSSAPQQPKAYFAKIASFVQNMDSPQICDAACTCFALAKERPLEMLEFLQPYLESQRDLDQRFAFVMLLDYFVNTDYIDDLLSRYSVAIPVGPMAEEGMAWGYQICYNAYPKKTFAILENLKMDKDMFNRILDKIACSKRLQPADRQALDVLRIYHKENDDEE